MFFWACVMSLMLIADLSSFSAGGQITVLCGLFRIFQKNFASGCPLMCRHCHKKTTFCLRIEALQIASIRADAGNLRNGIKEVSTHHQEFCYGKNFGH